MNCFPGGPRHPIRGRRGPLAFRLLVDLRGSHIAVAHARASANAMKVGGVSSRESESGTRAITPGYSRTRKRRGRQMSESAEWLSLESKTATTRDVGRGENKNLIAHSMCGVEICSSHSRIDRRPAHNLPRMLAAPVHGPLNDADVPDRGPLDQSAGVMSLSA